MASALTMEAPSAPKWSAWAWPAGTGILLGMLGFAQFVIGTDPTFTALVLLFTGLWLITVKILGGIKTIFGLCVGFMGAQHIVISQVAKAFMGQRPDTPLHQPVLTMQIYVLGMAMILLAAVITRARPIQGIKPILVPEMRLDHLRMLAIVFTALMFARYAALSGVVSELHILLQFDFITPTAVATSTAYVVLSSNKRRAFGMMTFLSVAVPFLFGIAFSQRKESSYALIIFVVTAIAFGFKFKVWHYIIAAVAGYFFIAIVFPFALYARGITRSETFIKSLGKSWDVFLDVAANPAKYQKLAAAAPPPEDVAARRMYYYGFPEPNLDRMSLVIVTDALVQATVLKGQTGWETIDEGFDMVVPRAFNQGKEIVGTSNKIAQRAPGVVNDLDRTTSITLGFFLEGFLSFGWLGAAFTPFLIALTYFIIYRFVLYEGLKSNVWACALFVFLPWTFSEGTIQQNLLQTLQNGPLFGAVGLVIVIFVNSMSKRRNLQAERVEDLPAAWKPAPTP
jgi:hypothetical protein